MSASEPLLRPTLFTLSFFEVIVLHFFSAICILGSGVRQSFTSVRSPPFTLFVKGKTLSPFPRQIELGSISHAFGLGALRDRTHRVSIETRHVPFRSADWLQGYIAEFRGSRLK